MRCGKCWGEGHLGTRCKSKQLNPAAMPYWANKPRLAAPKPTPATKFDDILLKPCPLAAPTLPNNRPKRLSVHIEGDIAIKGEIAKLGNSVVFDTHGHELGFKLADIAGFATRTKVVSANEISIGILSPGRFLITLPPGMAPETFIRATGPELWDAGFSFQPWSALDGAKLAIPEYKALLTLDGLPPFLRKDEYIAKAISTFGIFLGTVPQQGIPDLSLWTVAVAMDRLERIPQELAVYALGLEFILKVSTKNWMRAPLYTAAELPKHQEKFSKPIRTANPGSSDDTEQIPIARRVLIDLCKNIDPSALPEEIKALLAGPPGGLAITFAQTEELLSMNPSPVLMNRVVGQQHSSPTDHTQTNTPPTPQEIQGTKELDKAPVIPSVHPSEMDVDQGHTEPAPQETNAPKPQQIKPPIQILKRPPTNNTEDDNDTLIPRTIAQNVAGGQDGTIGRRQTKNNDKAETSRVRQRTAGSKGKEVLGSKAQFKTKKVRGVQQPKFGRVVNLQIPPKPTTFKPSAGRAKQNRLKEAGHQAGVILSPDGFYEVSVQYDHLENIGRGCGIKAGDVEQALQSDNIQRRVAQLTADDQGSAEEGPTLSFGSEDEFSSDQDLV